MATSIRILPAVMALAVGVLAFKGIDLAQAFAEAVEDDVETAEASAEVAEEAPPESPLIAGQPDASCLPSLNYASELSISEQEILVLRSLADRRKVLDEREAGIVTREQVALAAETRLDEQITELKALEAEVTRLLETMDAKRDERMAALVRTYEAMKPKDAGAIFNAMDDKVLVDLAKSMKPATLAAIMSAMDTRRAEALTRMLAALAEPQQVSAPVSQTPAAATPG